MKRIIIFITLTVVFLIGNLSLANSQVLTANVPMLKLNNGIAMPQFGLGTFTATNEACKEACLVALKTAIVISILLMHTEMNQALEPLLRRADSREEIWITSKLWPSEYGEGTTMEAIDKMLARLNTPYIDLCMFISLSGILWEPGKIWKKQLKRGKFEHWVSVISMTVTKFSCNCRQYENKAGSNANRMPPLCSTIERQRESKTLRNSHRMLVPVRTWKQRATFDPVIGKIAETHNKTIAQIILRWHIQEGFSVIPGATNPDYIKENISIFDFELSDEEMTTMRSLNKEKRFFNMTLEQKQGFVNMKMED